MDEELWGLEWDDEPDADAGTDAEAARSEPQPEAYRPRWVDDLAAPDSEASEPQPAASNSAQAASASLLSRLSARLGDLPVGRLSALFGGLSRRSGDVLVATVDGLAGMGNDTGRAMSGITRIMLGLTAIVVLVTLCIALLPGNTRPPAVIIVTGTPTFTPTATETPTATQTLGIPTLPPSWTPIYTPVPLPTWTPPPTQRPPSTQRPRATATRFPTRTHTPFPLPAMPAGWTAYSDITPNYVVGLPSDWLRLDKDPALRESIISEIFAVNSTYGAAMNEMLTNPGALSLSLQAVQYNAASKRITAMAEMEWVDGGGFFDLVTLTDLNANYIAGLPNLNGLVEVEYYTSVDGIEVAVLLYDLDDWGPAGPGSTSSYITFIGVVDDDVFYLTLSCARADFGQYYYTFLLIAETTTLFVMP